jgi:hypothetical protein
MRTDRRTDTMKLIVELRDFANAFNKGVGNIWNCKKIREFIRKKRCDASKMEHQRL